MKKKLLALVCALVMIFSLASCGLSTPDTCLLYTSPSPRD